MTVEQIRKKRTPLWVSRGILLATAVLFSAIGIAMLKVADQSIEDSEWVSHTFEVISNIEDVQATFLNAESSIRAYVVSESTDYKDAFNKSSFMLPDEINKLQNLVSDNPEQTQNTQQLRELIAKRLSQMNNTLNAFEEGGIESARLAIKKNVSLANLELKQQFLLLIANEQDLLVERKARSFKSFELLKTISVSGIPVGLLMVFMVYVLLSRELKYRALAEQGALISNSELAVTVEKLEKTSSDLNALSNYGSFLQSCKTIEEAVGITTQVIAKLMPDSGGRIYLMKASKNLMELAAEWGANCGAAPQTIMPSECWGIRRSKPNFSEEGSYTPPCTHIHETIKPGETWLCLELASQGGQLGLLTLSAESGDLHTRFPVIEAAMEQLALSLSSLQLRNVLEYQSTRDDLTGLYNRRYMDESFRQLHARSTRHAESYSLLMLDIDHFKNFNDVYGHEGGDIVLREIGKILVGLRADDIACRYGGEELAIALPNTGSRQAIEIANRLREKIQNARIEYNSATMTAVTVSIGVATFPEHGDDCDDIRKKSDTALYRAKHAGRNIVVVYTD